MVVSTSLVVIAGHVPVLATTAAPSGPETNYTKSSAASWFLEFLATERPVMVEAVDPASTPSGCGYLARPQCTALDSPDFSFAIWVAMNQLPIGIEAICALKNGPE